MRYTRQRHTHARTILIAVSRVNRRRPFARTERERHREERACRPACGADKAPEWSGLYSQSASGHNLSK